MRNELGQDRVRAADGFCSYSRISPLRHLLWRRVPHAELLLLGPISVDGLHATDISREFARHRNVPARDSVEFGGLRAVEAMGIESGLRVRGSGDLGAWSELDGSEELFLPAERSREGFRSSSVGLH